MIDNDSNPTSAVGRRSVLKAAAWSAPAVALSVATPAMAASTSTPRVLGVGPLDSATLPIQRCESVPLGAIAFRTLVNGVPGPVNGADGTVTVELPDGLRFTGTGTASTVSLPPEAGTGLVKVPAVQAVGAAGRYSVIARFQGATATISVDVTAGGTSDIFALPFARSTIRGAVPLADVRHVSVSDSAYAFVDGSGALYVSGSAYGVPFDQPRQIFAGQLPRVIGLDLDAIHEGPWYNNLLVHTADNRVFFIYSQSSMPSALREAGGFSGTVTKVHSRDGMYYVETTEGVFYAGAGFGGSTVERMRKLPGSEGATSLTVWGENHSGRRTGGAFVNSAGEIVWFGAVDASSTYLNIGSVPNGVRSMVAGNDSLIVLDRLGNLMVRGNAWQGVGAQNAFKTVKQDAAELSGWTRYFSGTNNGYAVLGADGSVWQGFGSNLSYFAPEKIQGLDSVVITRVFANDGTYQALASDGSIWSWTGNNDWVKTGYGRISAAAKSSLPDGFVVSDFLSRGYHTRSKNAYWGWGLAFGQTTCALA